MALVEAYARMVGTVIWRATGRRDVIEDLTQETFLRVFRALDYFDSRARLSTWIYTIAHNVAIGQHCLIMGQAGFAGSTQLGDYCVIASQSGIAGHLKLGKQATVGAKSGVMRNIPDGGTVLGIPAAPDKQAKRQMIAVSQLPELIPRTRELEKQLAALQAQSGA